MVRFFFTFLPLSILFLFFLLLGGCIETPSTPSEGGGKKPAEEASLFSFNTPGYINGANEGDFSVSGTCLEPEKVTNLRYRFFQQRPKMRNKAIRASRSSFVTVEPIEGALTCLTPENGVSTWILNGLDFSDFEEGEVFFELILEGFSVPVQTLVKDISVPEYEETTGFDGNHINSVLTLEGTCTEDGEVSVAIPILGTQGEFQTSCSGQAWSLAVNLAERGEGDYVFQVSFEDLAGNPAAAVVEGSITLDKTPPVLSIDSTANDPINSVNEDSYTVEGDCENDAPLVATINQQGVSSEPTCSSNRWSLAIPASLSSGQTHEVGVVATDLAGNETSVRAEMYKNTAVPTIAAGPIAVPGNSTYDSGVMLTYTVSFNKNVVVTGAPRIPLTITDSSDSARSVHALYDQGASNGADVAFSYRVQNGDDGTLALSGGIDLNSGTIADAFGNPATLTSLSVPSGSAIVLSALSPDLSGVTSSSTGAKKQGTTLVLTGTFSEAVTVTGEPRLAVRVGSAATYATYAGGSGSTTLTFNYTVGAGDDSSVEVTAIDLPSGASLLAGAKPIASFSPITIPSLIVDNTPPQITGLSNDTNVLKEKIWNWDCQDESPCKYRHTVTGQSGHTFDDQNDDYGSDLTFTERDSNDLRYLHVQAKDEADNFSPVITVSVRLDNTAPSQQGSVELPLSQDYGIGDDLIFKVVFNEVVVVQQGTPPPHLTITLGDVVKEAVYQSESGQDTMKFLYQIEEGDEDHDGVAVGTEMVLNGATIEDTLGNETALTEIRNLSVPSPTNGVLVDGASPILEAVSAAAKTYLLGETISFTAVFSEPVTITTEHSRAQLRLALTSGVVAATHEGNGNLSATHTFSYEVVEGDFDNDDVNGGVEVSGFYFNGEAIADQYENPLASQVLDSNLVATDVFIEGTTPRLTGLENDPNPKVSASWSWGCDDETPPCSYRHVVNTSSTHVFTSEDYSTDTTSAEEGTPSQTTTYYLHIQVKDGVGNESDVKSFFVILTSTEAPLVAVAETGTDYKPLLTISNIVSGDTVNLYEDSACQILVGGPLEATGTSWKLIPPRDSPPAAPTITTPLEQIAKTVPPPVAPPRGPMFLPKLFEAQALPSLEQETPIAVR